MRRDFVFQFNFNLISFKLVSCCFQMKNHLAKCPRYSKANSTLFANKMQLNSSESQIGMRRSFGFPCLVQCISLIMNLWRQWSLKKRSLFSISSLIMFFPQQNQTSRLSLQCPKTGCPSWTKYLGRSGAMTSGKSKRSPPVRKSATSWTLPRWLTWTA